MLERRPDIRQAEQELIAANAQIGAAKADYFPRISLTGFFGAQSRQLSDLLSGPAVLASAGVGAAGPIFNAGRTRNNVHLAEAIHGEALVNYQRVIYSAFRDVSDGLAAYAKTNRAAHEQEQLVETLTASAQLAAQRYQGGLDSYLPGPRCAAKSLPGRARPRAPAAAGSRRRSFSCIGRSAVGGRRKAERRG